MPPVTALFQTFGSAGDNSKKSTVSKVYITIKGKTIYQRLGFDIWRRHFLSAYRGTPILPAKKDSHETHVSWESELVAGEGLEPTTSGL